MLILRELKINLEYKTSHAVRKLLKTLPPSFMYGNSKTSLKFCIPETGFWIAKSRILVNNLLLRLMCEGQITTVERFRIWERATVISHSSIVLCALFKMVAAGILNST